MKVSIIFKGIPLTFIFYNMIEKIQLYNLTTVITSYFLFVIMSLFSKGTSTSETDDLSGTKRHIIVPKADIRKRKKTYDDTEIALLESSKAINTMCSELPKLLQSTTVKVTQDETEEDKAMVTVLLQSIKRIPKNKKSRCMMKIFEVIQLFEEVYD